MKKGMVLVSLVLLLTCAVSHTLAIGAAAVPATRLQTRYSGLTSPIFLTHAGDGTRRIFIVERAGIIKVVQPGSNVPTVFLNITSLTTTTGERGLLSVAFHPQYRTNRRFFCYFTRASDGAIQVSEFQASAADPNVADTTERPIITIPHPGQSNHNGGTLAFGPDGYLYAGPGDGGSGNDPPNNAQNINSLLGKMIRIDIDVPPTQTPAYNIPATNPFAGSTPGADEIFALGLRNPFRWSFDRGGTRQLWLADVGQNSWEEVDIIVNGGNYGWRVYEGNACTNLDPGLCVPANYVAPVFVYSSQNNTQRCSITGGYVYRGTQGTLPSGSYTYGDYCTGEVLLWHNNQQIPLHDIADFNLVSFGEDEDGELYVVMAGGLIQKIVPAKASADFDGDFRTDLGIFRPSDNTWYLRSTAANSIQIQPFGAAGDVPAAEDFDGDRRMDIAVFRPSTGFWYYIRSTDFTFNVRGWGQNGDVPAPGDYDGDGRADLVVFRPNSGSWHLNRSSDGSFATVNWGVATDLPVAADYDGDGKYDIAVWRPSNGTWYSINSTNNAFQVNGWGEAADIPAPGDFDGDGRSDLAVFRPSTGLWYQKRSSNGFFVTIGWGVAGDVPVVGDYDNDDRDDVAVFRGSNGIWYVVGSTSGIVQLGGWGVAGDVPLPSRDGP